MPVIIKDDGERVNMVGPAGPKSLLTAWARAQYAQGLSPAKYVTNIRVKFCKY